MELNNRLFRSSLLTLAGNPAAERFASKYGLKLGADRFVAGNSLSQALEAIKALNEHNIATTLDHLGEQIESIRVAEAFKNDYLQILEAIDAHKVDSTVSLKPTQMGMAFDREKAFGHIAEIVRKADALQNSVTVDMEDSPYTEATIDTVLRLREQGYRNVGTVIQAYLYRSEADVRQLTDAGIELRLVKGAYKEPETIAYQKMKDVDANFIHLIRMRLDSGVYTAIATHDQAIVDWTREYVTDRGIPKHAYEFQMLYGIRMATQEQLALEGYRVRCYVPYGEQWYPYFVRRLAERPANLAFILKNALRR